MTKDVTPIYDKISTWYLERRSTELFEKPYLDHFISLLPEDKSVLDLGCGAGLPMAEYLLQQKCSVVGVDGSEVMLTEAAKNCPTMTLIHHDMRTIKLERKFAGILAWHSFFHLPQEDQRQMFPLFREHLHPQGALMFTSGPEAGEVFSDNGGEQLYHASLSQEEYKKHLEENGFEVIALHVEDKACRGATIWLTKLIK